VYKYWSYCLIFLFRLIIYYDLLQIIINNNNNRHL